jgi:pimeloyl-ACP methyl ester carboxylesterase
MSESCTKNSVDFAVTVKPFMERFSDENKIVVIDRAGYGMSDDTKIPQTVEQIVSDYRTVLKNSGCEAPYILVAHSLGGDYATYWENTYPDEIEGVVYFDPNDVLGDHFIYAYKTDEVEAAVRSFIDGLE